MHGGSQPAQRPAVPKLGKGTAGCCLGAPERRGTRYPSRRRMKVHSRGYHGVKSDAQPVDDRSRCCPGGGPWRRVPARCAREHDPAAAPPGSYAVHDRLIACIKSSCGPVVEQLDDLGVSSCWPVQAYWMFPSETQGPNGWARGFPPRARSFDPKVPAARSVFGRRASASTLSCAEVGGDIVRS